MTWKTITKKRHFFVRFNSCGWSQIISLNSIEFRYLVSHSEKCGCGVVWSASDTTCLTLLYIEKPQFESKKATYFFLKVKLQVTAAAGIFQLLRRSLQKLATKSIMASDRQQFEEGSTDDYGSELNTSPTDELAAVSALAR